MEAKDLNRGRIRRIYILTAAGTILWLAAIIAAPWLRSRGSGAAGFVYACFGPICHQNPARSFFLWGYPLAVCARCLGVYAGFAGGVFCYPFRRGFSATRLPSLTTLAVASAPIALDAAANILRLWNTGGGLRFLTGFLWGLILPFYFLTGIVELFASRKSGSSQNSARSESTASSPEKTEIPQ